MATTAAGQRVGAQDTASAHGAPATGSVLGAVRDSAGAGIAGATVEVEGTPLMTQTDDAGAFSLYGVALGPLRLRVRRLGFSPAAVDAEVRAGGGPPVRVTLAGVAQRLTPVVVRGGAPASTGRLADFDRRRRLGIGHYFTRAEIDRRAVPRVTDMLRMVPGVRIREDDTGRTAVRMRGQTCPPLVWVDGLPLGGGDMDPDFVPPRDIEAIEVYSGSSRVPSELLGPWQRGQCGVIVVWLRDGERAPPKRKPVAVAAHAPVDAKGAPAVFMAESVDEPALLDDAPLALAYPESLLVARVEGAVTAEFVVDASGRADTTTFGIVSSSHPLFTDAVRAAIGKAVFRPARLRGRPVRQVVYLPVAFVLPGETEQPRASH